MVCIWNCRSSCWPYHPQSANWACKPHGKRGRGGKKEAQHQAELERISIRADHGLDVKDVGGGVVGAPPGRAEEHHVGAQAGRQRHEVPAQEIDVLGHAVHLRVVPRQPQLLGIDVDGDHCPRDTPTQG